MGFGFDFKLLFILVWIGVISSVILGIGVIGTIIWFIVNHVQIV